MFKRNFITLHRNNQYIRKCTSHLKESQNNPNEQKEQIEHNIHTYIHEHPTAPL